MNAAQAEPAVEGAANFVGSFFSNLPMDTTQFKVEWIKVLPVTSIDANVRSVIYVMPKLEYPYSYKLQDLMMSARIKIVDKDGNLPGPNAHVTGIN